MPRPKKEENILEETFTVSPQSSKETIVKLELDLNREDLNKLVAKLNEVIEALNKI